MADNEGGKGGGSRVLGLIRHHAPAFVLGVVASVVASFAITWIGYNAGYSQGRIEGAAVGRDAGETARYAELDAEITEERSRRMSDLKGDIETRREERIEALDAQIKRARTRRMAETEEEMDDLVMAQCGREMQGEFDRGQRTGSRAGLAKGREEGERRVAELRREMESTCTAQMNEARSISALWNRFENLILRSGEYAKEDGEAVRAYVGAVIRVALAGREAGDNIASVFNGDIDELIEALEADDIERALAIIERLELTLPDIYAIFEPAFNVLAMGLEEDDPQ